MSDDPADWLAARERWSSQDPLVNALGRAIATYRVRRVPLSVLRTAHAQLDPTGASNSDARARLDAALRTLVVTGAIVMPRTAKLFERHVAPALPTWVERTMRPRVAPVLPAARVWRPELAAAATLVSSAAEHNVVTCVDTFIRNGGATRPVVPHRERSVEVFGNEKRLDSLLRTKMFTSGALTLDLLRCYVPPLPLTAQHIGDPGSSPQLLIVENHATYASVLSLARQRAEAGQGALAVGYGSGNQLPSAIAGASQLYPAPAAIWYFGDLDKDGLAIARGADAAARSAGLPPVRPALPLYRALFAHGRCQVSKSGPVGDVEALGLAGWLSDEQLRAAALEVLIRGQRLAQESVGYEVMSMMPIWY